MMVSNVSYGRTIYVKLETTSKEKKVEAAFKLLNGQDLSKNKEYEDIIEDTQFTAVVLGGDSGRHSKVVTKDFDEIRDLITENAEFSLQNPAYPISYTSNFLKDNAVAKVHNYTEYVETSSKRYNSGRINLNHRGAYVAQFDISWDEVSYDEEGNEVLEHKEWQDNREGRTAPFQTTIYLPANARNLNIQAKECTGLAWEWWRTVIDEQNVALAPEINVSIGGTTLHPWGSVEFQ